MSEGRLSRSIRCTRKGAKSNSTESLTTGDKNKQTVVDWVEDYLRTKSHNIHTN